MRVGEAGENRGAAREGADTDAPRFAAFRPGEFVFLVCSQIIESLFIDFDLS